MSDENIVKNEKTQPEQNADVSSEEQQPQQSEIAAADNNLAKPEMMAAVNPVTDNVIWLDGANGDDNNDGSTQDKAVKTFAKAKKLVPDNGTIKVLSFVENQGIVLDKPVTLEIAEDITIDGAGTATSGIVLKNGAILQCAEGKTLTMKNYATTITSGVIYAESGAKITDGIYNISGAGQGVWLKGPSSVEGTAKDKLILTSDGGYAPNFIVSTESKQVNFKNCTATFISQSTARISWTLFGAWVDAGVGILNLDNADVTIKGIGGGAYFTPHISNDSVLTIDKYNREIATALTWSGNGEIVDSTVNIKTGSTAGISVSPNLKGTIQNSTINFNNNGYGGLNVTGNMLVENSVLNGNGPSALVGSGKGGTGVLTMDEKTIVNTNGALGGNSISGVEGFIVEGGTYKFDFSKAFASNGGVTGSGDPTPVNKFGDELSLFQLADSSGRTLDIPNQDGSQTYPYEVPDNAGEKYVWLPKVNVSFDPNGGQFGDGTSAVKEFHAARGLSVDGIKSWNTVPTPKIDIPSRVGKQFAGWFYKDDETKAFDSSLPVTKDTAVVAHWVDDANSYGISYNNNIP